MVSPSSNHLIETLSGANEVFLILPRPTSEQLLAKGASFYPWTTDSLPAGVMPGREAGLVRLVTSFATTAGEVDEFVATAMAR